MAWNSFDGLEKTGYAIVGGKEVVKVRYRVQPDGSVLACTPNRLRGRSDVTVCPTELSAQQTLVGELRRQLNSTKLGLTVKKKELAHLERKASKALLKYSIAESKLEEIRNAKVRKRR
jgi:hypothetical protein